MYFPKWVTPSKSTKAQQATNRLRYLIGRLAIEYSSEGTLKSLCRKVGISHSTVSIYVQQGKFSEAMADRFEKTFPGLITAFALTNPLDLIADKAPAK